MNPLDIIEKYYDPQSELYHILVTHSRLVTQKALEVAGRHPDLQADRNFIAEAGMLHDIGIIMCNAPGIQCYGTHQYIEHGYLGAELLRQEGLPEHAHVAERHTGTGISQQQIEQAGLPIPPADYFPISIEEQIICYADKFFSKTRLTEEKTLEQARTSLKKFGDATIVRFDDMHRRFG